MRNTFAVGTVLLVIGFGLTGCKDTIQDACREFAGDYKKAGRSEIETYLVDSLRDAISIEYVGLNSDMRSSDPAAKHKGALQLRIKNSSFVKTKGLTLYYKVFADGRELRSSSLAGTWGGTWPNVTTGSLARPDFLLSDTDINDSVDIFHQVKSASKVTVKLEKAHPESIELSGGADGAPKLIRVAQLF